MEQLNVEGNLCLNETKNKCNCENSTYCTRFCRKKYKCCLLWLLSIISVSQLLYITLDKIDTSLLENMLSRYLKMAENSTNLTSPWRKKILQGVKYSSFTKKITFFSQTISIISFWVINIGGWFWFLETNVIKSGSWLMVDDWFLLLFASVGEATNNKIGKWRIPKREIS